MSKPILSVSNLQISFLKEKKWTPTVKDISFDLRSGETLGIVGESGSGKSVSSLALLGLLPKGISRIDTGIAVFDDSGSQVNLFETSSKSEMLRGKEIGMIFQEPMTSLNPVYTCGNQICETIQKHLNLNSSKARELAEEWFSKVELPNPKRIYDSFPHELSGGQRQRVMIAMAMCCKPKLLIADEPTTALDVTVQKKVLDLIKKLQEENKTAVIFISHDLGVVKNIADRVLVMKGGELQEFGETNQVFESPKSTYTKGLIRCKPENTNKSDRLLTVEEVLKGSSESVPRSDQKVLSEEIILKVKDLKKSYVKKKSWWSKQLIEVKAVDQVSFEIRRGETMGLVGESGCGKSTLSKIISGLLKADSGSLIFNGIDISAYSQKDWRALRGKIQFIFQDPYSALNPRHSVQQVLLEVLTKHQQELTKSQREEECQKLIVDVGLTEESLYKFPHQFSGGQRQRIVIARALAAQPEFIIADESVSALDVSVQAQVLNLLNELKAKYKLTYLFISHDLSVVNYMSDNLLVMKSGKIVESGVSDDIYEKPSHPYTKELLQAVYS